MHVTVYSPFFFMEMTITGIVYLDMLQQFLIPQLEEDDQEECIHFQPDGASPHYLEEVCKYRNTRFQVGGLVTLFPGSYNPGFFLMGIR
jgi:hypothetical protein